MRCLITENSLSASSSTGSSEAAKVPLSQLLRFHGIDESNKRHPPHGESQKHLVTRLSFSLDRPLILLVTEVDRQELKT